MSARAPGLMVCGTTSNAGKTTLVAGLCRVLARQGLAVAPFKAQNMALNSAVTADGHEIGRAQYLQSQAAGVEPEVAMNPILLKPTGERHSQVIVEGRPLGTMSAVEYHEAKPELLPLVMRSLESLRSRFDVVVLEGAGSPAEINLLDHDIVNLRIATEAGLPAIVVGDIDLGGVFAALHGTVELLPRSLRPAVKGFVINKFRGDPALLGDGLDQLQERSGLPTFGVLPLLADWHLDAEDSLALDVAPPPKPDAHLDVAVIRLPHISNFTDLDPLLAEPDVAVRFVRSARELGRPDLIVIPGSKATVEDLRWLRERGLAELVTTADAVVLGICGGYQMLGAMIDDDVESGAGAVAGLGMLPVKTTFGPEKVLTRRRGCADGALVAGYQIHHGRVSPLDPDRHSAPAAGDLVRPDAPTTVDRVRHGAAAAGERDGSGMEAWLVLDDGPEGFRQGRVHGTTLHGLFESDDFRQSFLHRVARDRATSFSPSASPFATVREAAIDRLADSIEEHLDLDRIAAVIGIEGIST